MVENELELNTRAFYEQLPTLLAGNQGRFAVGRAGDTFECWDTRNDAEQRGYQKYQDKSFIICPVQEIPTGHRFFRNLPFAFVTAHNTEK